MLRHAAVVASVSLLVACNSLTGVGDLHVTGDGGHSGVGGSSGPSQGAGAHGSGDTGAGASQVGPSSGAGPGSTTGVGPASSGAGPTTTGAGGGPASSSAVGAGGAATSTVASSVAASTVASSVAASTAASSVASTGSGTTDPAQMCVDFINQKRASIGMGPLARWSSAETCVDGQAQTDAANNMAHSAFQACGEWAQNECPGWPGPPDAMIDNCLQAMWNEGPGGGHYDNMTRSSYTKVACGFYVLPNGSVWAAQDFTP